MKSEIIDEVIACLPEERTLFRYFKGQYAFMLLSYASKKRQTVGAIKQSPYHRLLNQPEIKSLLSKIGSGKLSPDLFDYAWKESSESFVLTLDRWGSSDRSWDQVTRPGSSLVLQLNFSEKHNRAYEKMVKPEDEFVFNFIAHPVMSVGKRRFFRNTLAWSRLDVDLDNGEVLIEEIQSDWVGYVRSCLQRIRDGKNNWLLDCCGCKPEQFIDYAENVFAPFASLWSEAMLMATISFIYAELGIRDIYYHTYETGSRVKRIDGKPPRSLYSDLPRRFCFQVTDKDPVFLQKDRQFTRNRRKIKNVDWYKLEL